MKIEKEKAKKEIVIKAWENGIEWVSDEYDTVVLVGKNGYRARMTQLEYNANVILKRRNRLIGKLTDLCMDVTDNDFDKRTYDDIVNALIEIDQNRKYRKTLESEKSRKTSYLDDGERAYLSSILKPYVISIMRMSVRKEEFPTNVEGLRGERIVITGPNTRIELPPFKAGAMYIGLKPGREYDASEDLDL